MSKDILQTIAVIAAVFMGAWHISGMVAANAAAISEVRAEISDMRGAIADNTAAIAKLEGALLAHIGGHSHSAKVAAAGPESTR